MPALYQNNKDIPSEMLIGNLLFYNLTNMTVSENDLLNAFSHNNLPLDYVKKISHADAFRRATSTIKNMKVDYIDDQNQTFEGRINVDEVVNDKLYIKRIVGVRVLNDQKEEVSYTQLGSFTFERATESISSYLDPQGSGYVASCHSMFTQVETRYMTYATYHNHDTIKNIILRIVNSMHPVALMPTGINKFIPSTYDSTLYGLKGLLDELSQYSDSGMDENTVEIIPVLDTQEHRDLVNKMYQKEITDSLYEYSMELTDILKKKSSLSSRQAMTYLERYNDLINKSHDYQTLLGTYEESIQAQLRTALRRIEDNKEKDEENV